MADDSDISIDPTASSEGGESAPGASSAGVGGLSDVGRVRELNEDNWHWERLDADTVLYAVADGMGGHDRGEVASRIAVETLFVAAKEGLAAGAGRDVTSLRELMRNSVQRANRAVVASGEEHDSNMGTTLTCGLLYKDAHAVVANVGDSRAYLLRGGELRAISQDHSLVAYLVQLGELTSEEARTHPSGNILVRSIGSMPEVEVDVYHLEVLAGDRLMICSDGLWGELPDVQIRDLMNDNADPQAACQALVDHANDAGGRDNTTLVIFDV